MTGSSDRRNDAYRGEQDDYFDKDLAVAGQEIQIPDTQKDALSKADVDRGQQDDYFDRDLENSARSSHEDKANPQQ